MKYKRFFHYTFWSFWGGLSLLLISEVGLRTAGCGDFPIFDADAEIGYVPRPSQSGVFLRDKDWVINADSMLNRQPFLANQRDGVLLLSDSIVWGGVAYKHDEKLGPQLQASLGDPWRVWSVGAGSWAVLNELTWLKRHVNVSSGMAQIVWLINSEDLDARSQWSSEFTHPTHHPLWLGGYLVSKAMADHGWWPASSLPAKQVHDVDAKAALTAYCSELRVAGGARIHLVFYPDAAELAAGSNVPNKVANTLAEVAGKTGAVFHDLRRHPQWKGSDYKDAIHPSPAGNRRLAEVLRKWLLEDSDR